MLRHDHERIFILQVLGQAVVLAVGIPHVVFEVAELLHFLFDVLSFANEQLQGQLSIAQIDWDAQLQIILVTFEPIEKVLGDKALSPDKVKLEIRIQQVLPTRCKVIKLGVRPLHDCNVLLIGASNMLELAHYHLHYVVAPRDGQVGILILPIEEVVEHDEEDGEHAELELIVDPVILRLVLEEANDLVLEGVEGAALGHLKLF